MRTCGILMPLFSLPSPHGIGTLGRGAYRFVDFLRESGQHYWQLLPIGPTGYGDSPYQSFCAFAGNPYFIDPNRLEEDGLLTRAEIEAADCECDPGRIDYQMLYQRRFALLRQAAGRLNPAASDFKRFCGGNSFWLEDYALFMALKRAHGEASWQDWPEAYRMRQESALERARSMLAEEIFFWKAVQFLFDRQYRQLKRYANQNEIELVGDIPIYVSPDSSELWAQSELFQTTPDRTLSRVAGVPPDGFSADGQVWGNPLYDWKRHKEEDFAWWIRRLRHAGGIYDVVRIDHFRGFAGYFSIPAGEDTAKNGRWETGPGLPFLHAIRRALPDLRIIAEDLGYLTDDVRKLLQASGYPGMKLLQFAFDSREASDYLPHHYGRNSVVYTGTHDNTTTRDWQESAPPDDVALARDYLNAPPGSDLTEAMIRAALASVCDTAIIPLPDWLNLGREGRINTPSTLGGNWVWRCAPNALTGELSERILHLTRLYGR